MFQWIHLCHYERFSVYSYPRMSRGGDPQERFAVRGWTTSTRSIDLQVVAVAWIIRFHILYGLPSSTQFAWSTFTPLLSFVFLELPSASVSAYFSRVRLSGERGCLRSFVADELRCGNQSIITKSNQPIKPTNQINQPIRNQSNESNQSINQLI